MGKVWIIAETTYRETARQPIYYILMLFFAAVIYFSRFFTLFAFQEGDEQNMIREMGIASITICGVLLSVVMASVVITSEVEKLTTLTVLSKPIGRGEFILGKYLGLVLAFLFAVFFLFLVFIYTLWVKEVLPGLEEATSGLIYAREAGVYIPDAPLYQPVDAPLHPRVYFDLAMFYEDSLVTTFKGTILSFFQVAIISALAVAIAPHFSLVFNGSASFLLFALGHLTQYIQLQAEEASTLFGIVAQVLVLVLPNLGYFNAASLLATKSQISSSYVAATCGYGVLYITIILALANVLFSRKEVK